MQNGAVVPQIKASTSITVIVMYSLLRILVNNCFCNYLCSRSETALFHKSSSIFSQASTDRRYVSFVKHRFIVSMLNQGNFQNILAIGDRLQLLTAEQLEASE